MTLRLHYKVKLFFSYFIFALLLTFIVTLIHLYFSDKKSQNVFEYRAKEMLIDKIQMMKNFVSDDPSPQKLKRLMRHLHSSETFKAYCINPANTDPLYLHVPSMQWMKLENNTVKKALNTIANFNQKEFSIFHDKKKVILPVPFVQTNSGQNAYMIYIAKEKLLDDCDRNNFFMIAWMGLAMFLLSFPFAYIVSRPLSKGFEYLQKQKKNLQTQIDKDVQELSKKNLLLTHQSKLASMGDAIGNIAHQWKLPLTRIQLVLQNLESLQTPGHDTKTTNTLIAQAKEQIQYMSETIDVFQNFYKTDCKHSFVVHEAVDQALKIVRQTLQSKHITLELVIKDYDAKASGRANEFGQVILNLVANAKDELIRNKTQNARITVTIQKHNHKKVSISVKDNAGGINDAIQEKLFHPNFTTKGKNGSGLGLYMSKTIIKEKFFGNIYADNSPEGGAIFTIIIPVIGTDHKDLDQGQDNQK